MLRIGIALVYLYFGTSQLRNPDFFLGWLPNWTSNLIISQTNLIYINGTFEVIVGLMLLIGLFTKTSSFLLGLHLLFITIHIGYTEIGVRDFGLTMATFAITLLGKDKYSADHKRKKQ